MSKKADKLQYCNIFVFVIFFFLKLFSVFFFWLHAEPLLDPISGTHSIMHTCSHSFTVSLSALYWPLGDISMSIYTEPGSDLCPLLKCVGVFTSVTLCVRFIFGMM